MILRGSAIRGLGGGEGFYFVVRGERPGAVNDGGRLLRVGAGGQPWFPETGVSRNFGLVEQD